MRHELRVSASVLYSCDELCCTIHVVLFFKSNNLSGSSLHALIVVECVGWWCHGIYVGITFGFYHDVSQSITHTLSEGSLLSHFEGKRGRENRGETTEEN